MNAALRFGWLLILLVLPAARAQSIPPGYRLLADNYACTFYFTPLESGYTPAAGFTKDRFYIPVARRAFSRDFLAAVRMEGQGRIDPPVQGHAYLRFDGHWSLADRPMGNSSNPLTPGVSCSVRSSGLLKAGQRLLIRSAHLPASVQANPWRVDDVGSGVKPRQIDLYMGERVSAGPGESLFQPAGLPAGRIGSVSVYVAK